MWAENGWYSTQAQAGAGATWLVILIGMVNVDLLAAVTTPEACCCQPHHWQRQLVVCEGPEVMAQTMAVDIFVSLCWKGH